MFWIILVIVASIGLLCIRYPKLFNLFFIIIMVIAGYFLINNIADLFFTHW